MGTQSVTEFLRNALAQVGDRHLRGAEASHADADPDTWDSSELVEWSAHRAGVELTDGSWLQYRQLQREGGGLPIEDALRTPGALVFTFSSDPMASPERPASAGVAISLGNGQLITVAPGGAVDVVDAGTRELTHAAVMPELGEFDRGALTALLAEHELRPLGHDPVDPDGDGVPLSPDEAGERILDLRGQADEIRRQAENAEAARDRHDADLEVARELLAERLSEQQLHVESVARAARAVAEAESDLARSAPELDAAHDRMVDVRRRLGLPVPSDELLDVDGTPAAPQQPPPVETDPAAIEQLRGELVLIEAELSDLAEQRKPFEDVVKQREGERVAAQRLADASAAAVAEQQADVDRLRAPELSADDLLQNARALVAEADDLEARADEVTRRWEAYEASHPDGPGTDLGEIVVESSGARAFAEGRRERAAELEGQAATAEREADAAERGAADRTELADVKDERADALRARADEAAVKAAALDTEIAQARDQMLEWTTTAEKRTADAARLRAAGRTDDAEVMDTRAQAADRQWMVHSSRIDELRADQAALRAQTEAWRAEATELVGQADILDEEASALGRSAAEADARADELQARAVTQDDYADRIDAAIDSGIATELHIIDQVEGIDVTVPIPGRPPVESDLDDLPGAAPDDELPTDQPPVIAPPEPAMEEAASDFAPEPEPDLAGEPFSGFGDTADDSTLA
jgi:hypothetical protein